MGGVVGKKKKKLLSCIRLKCWYIPGFHSWLITFLTTHGYWAVLSPLTFPTTLGKWLSSPELSLSTRPTHAVCYQPQTSLLVCLTVTEFSVCQKQNSSPSLLNLPLLVGSPKLYSIILDSSFPLTFSQLKSPTVLPFKTVPDSRPFFLIPLIIAPVLAWTFEILLPLQSSYLYMKKIWLCCYYSSFTWNHLKVPAPSIEWNTQDFLWPDLCLSLQPCFQQLLAWKATLQLYWIQVLVVPLISHVACHGDAFVEALPVALPPPSFRLDKLPLQYTSQVAPPLEHLPSAALYLNPPRRLNPVLPVITLSRLFWNQFLSSLLDLKFFGHKDHNLLNFLILVSSLVQRGLLMTV